MFKKIAIALATVLSAAMVPATTEPVNTASIYPDAGIVTEVDYTTDTVEVTMLNGNVFAFYGCDDWYMGDIAAMIMNDNGTPEVNDDIIVNSPEYAGHVSFIDATTSEDGFYINFRDGACWYEYE